MSQTSQSRQQDRRISGVIVDVEDTLPTLCPHSNGGSPRDRYMKPASEWKQEHTSIQQKTLFKTTNKIVCLLESISKCGDNNDNAVRMLALFDGLATCSETGQAVTCRSLCSFIRAQSPKLGEILEREMHCMRDCVSRQHCVLVGGGYTAIWSCNLSRMR